MQTASVELVSATGFRKDCVSLRVEYEVSLPPDWSADISSPDGNASSSTSVGSVTSVRGSTQQSSIAANGIRNILALNSALFALGSTLILCASYVVTAIFEEHSSVIATILSSLVLLIVSAVCLALRAPTIPTIHYFAHHLDLTSTRSRDRAITVVDHPILLIQVCARRTDGVITAAGCGLLRIPSSDLGKHEMNIQTWRVVGDGTSDLRFKLADYYLGTRPIQFDDMKELDCLTRSRSPDMSSTEQNGSFSGSSSPPPKFITAESGTVQVRILIGSERGTTSRKGLRCGRSRSRKETASISKPPPSNIREGIDDVLSRVRENRRERMLRDVYIDGVSPLDEHEDEED
eukprot:CAMPEP_0178725416 /NCGR_PEP_ID=MMETSP0699-20121125/26665_1 /TAXON_ID=265572 /ORGANISM="Extubocellulus spinifer, Strain CCMP396" /LENGTH=347 /DNA_ID=CAMNT_0020376755 /DNA_START=544 /DNA_END=1584 /DNA_ORIENTATION=+